MNTTAQSTTETYARQFYDLLVEQSKLEKLPPEDTEHRVWRGKLLEAFIELGASQIYYSRIRNIFLEYGCVTYVIRGTKAYPSVLILNWPPPEEISQDLLTGPSKGGTVQTLAEAVEEMTRRLRAVEDWRETTTGGLNIGEALRDLEKRLAKLEGNATNGAKAEENTSS